MKDFLQNYKHIKMSQCSIEPIHLKYNKMEKLICNVFLKWNS